MTFLGKITVGVFCLAKCDENIIFLQGEEDAEFSANAQRLEDIFNKEPVQRLRALLKEHGMHGAVNLLLDEMKADLRSRPSDFQVR